MLAWLLWQLERTERIRAAAGALMDEFGDEAYAEARRRECEAGREEMAAAWRRVALIIARWTPRRVGLEAAPPTLPEPSRRPRSFRNRREHSGSSSSAGWPTEGPTNLTEKQIEAPDAPAAIIAAANIKWPPQTIGVRILDREGHEVFARQKARRA